MPKPTETAMWGIHGGWHGAADHLFHSHNVIALGWHEMGDLSTIAPTREAFKKKVAATYPDEKPGAIPNYAGQLFRFVHEAKKGDLVVYPSKSDREVHIGIVQGPYQYRPRAHKEYPQHRPVKWVASRPRTDFSPGALYEVGSALSFFQVRNYAEEFRAVLEGAPPRPGPDEDDTTGLVAEEVEQQAADYVLRKLSRELKGHPFAFFVAHLLNAMGYRTRVSEAGPDGGVDIVAHRDELGFEPPIIKVQVKSTEGNTGDPDVSSLYGKVGPGEYGLFITVGGFTAAARAFAKAKGNLRLIDRGELVRLVFEHYEQFDSNYKALLPLKRVYVPATPEDSTG